jgi:hypothetical protein
LPRQLFFAILSTSSDHLVGLELPVEYGAVESRSSTSCSCVQLDVSLLPSLDCKMKNRTPVAELQNKLGMPSSDTIESLRLLKAFIRLEPGHRDAVIEFVERLAADGGDADYPGDPA